MHHIINLKAKLEHAKFLWGWWLTLQLSNNQPKSGVRHPLLTLTPLTDHPKTEKQKMKTLKDFKKFFIFSSIHYLAWLMGKTLHRRSTHHLHFPYTVLHSLILLVIEQGRNLDLPSILPCLHFKIDYQWLALLNLCSMWFGLITPLNLKFFLYKL